jgi:hypothetical protein
MYEYCSVVFIPIFVPLVLGGGGGGGGDIFLNHEICFKRN